MAKGSPSARNAPTACSIAPRLARIEPAAEGERAMRRRNADDRRIALDARFVGCRRPIHHQLRLLEQHGVRARRPARSAQRRCSSCCNAAARPPAVPPARRVRTNRIAVTTAEQRKPDNQCQRRDLVTIESPGRSAGRQARAGPAPAFARRRPAATESTPMAASNLPSHGRTQPRLVRIVSGMPLPPLLAVTAMCQPPPCAPPLAGEGREGESPRIARLYSQAESHRKSPDREQERRTRSAASARRTSPPCVFRFSALRAMFSRLKRLSAMPN